MDSERARESLGRERERIDLDPAHEPSDLSEVELDQGLEEDLRDQLAAVERAEQRLAAGTYGLSVESGKPIPDARLEAEPTAERTIEEQERFDRGA
jgi:DnaK suppressor protein